MLDFHKKSKILQAGFYQIYGEKRWKNLSYFNLWQMLRRVFWGDAEIQLALKNHLVWGIFLKIYYW